MEPTNTPLVIIYDGALAGTRWPLDKETVTFGRAADCDVVIAERQISRYHARLERDGEGYVLRDLGSKNGTFVNGEAVHGQPYHLRDGDEIALAKTVRLGFVAGEATLPLEEALLPILPRHGNLVVDASSCRVRLGRVELDPPLSPPQFRLLGLLMESAGRVVTREEVAREIWPDAVGGITDQAVDALVYRLRERLAELNPDHNYVVTVRGHGFRFEPD